MCVCVQVYNHHKDDVFWSETTQRRGRTLASPCLLDADVCLCLLLLIFLMWMWMCMSRSASDLGWAVGHSYIAYAPLLQGATTVLYEGKPVGTPDAGAFWRVIAQHKVTVLFTAPTALRAIKKEDSTGKLLPQYDLRHFKALYLAGERADPASLAWARDLLKVPVIDHFWQTESGWPIVGALRGVESFPVRDGSASFPVPGWDVRALDDEGHEVAAGTQANLVVKLPLPPGGVQELWGTRKRFEISYMDKFPGTLAHFHNLGLRARVKREA